jgi:hypothetical protein
VASDWAGDLDAPAHLEHRPEDPDDKPVPVEVKMVVWVNRRGWQDEYSIDPNEPGYDFEEAVRDWVIDEVGNYGVHGGNWTNVTEVTD